MSARINRPIFSWALYDWANSAFATTVMAGFFPVFYKEYWHQGVPVTTSTLHLGVTNSVTCLIIALLAPVLGALADRGGNRIKWLVAMAGLGIGATAALAFLGPQMWVAASLFFGIGMIGFAGGNIFYDSLIGSVCPPEKRDWVSALGYAMGYLGGGVLFAINVWMVLQPETFGIADSPTAIPLSFISVALWWALFTIPLFLYVPELPPSPLAKRWKLRATLAKLKALPLTTTFLIAYWLYIDGVDTVVRMAVDYGISIGIGSNDLIAALLLTQFVGFPSALAFGWLGERIGAKRGIVIAIGVYCAAVVAASQLSNANEFYALAAVIGLVQGGVQSLSRSAYSRMIPAGHEAEFFGLYNMVGKFAAILGPVLIGWVGALTGNPRVALLSLLILFLAGGFLLIRVDLEAAQAEAEAFVPPTP